MARTGEGLSLDRVASAIGISPSEVSRIERGLAPWVSVSTLCRAAAVVGLDLWARLYPGGEPLHDAGHLRLGDAFRALLGTGLDVDSEVRIGDSRDLRAWDLTLLDRTGDGCGVELETRVVDAQALLRRLMQKLVDSGLDRVLLVVAETRSSRAAVRAAAGMLAAVLTIDDPAAVEALRAGRVPPRNALIFVRVDRSPRPAAPREHATSRRLR